MKIRHITDKLKYDTRVELHFVESIDYKKNIEYFYGPVQRLYDVELYREFLELPVVNFYADNDYIEIYALRWEN